MLSVKFGLTIYEINTGIEPRLINSNTELNKLPKNYKGYIIKIKYALLEEQGPGFKKSFANKPLPIVVLRVGGQTKYQWSADLSFRLKLGAHDVLGTIDKVTGLKK